MRRTRCGGKSSGSAAVTAELLRPSTSLSAHDRLDGIVVGQYTKSGIPVDASWVFDAPFYLTFNIAVGGDWPGPPAATTTFPAQMLIDWVRYWQ